MKSRTRIRSLSRLIVWSEAFALVVVIGAFMQPPVAAAGRFSAQVNREGPVQVTVTPRSLAADAKMWEFDVVFNTHTMPVDGDPAKFSVLIDARGDAHNALAWNGDPPGGHHRKGVLQFKPIAGATEVELRINGVGGVTTRSFRWPL